MPTPSSARPSRAVVSSPRRGLSGAVAALATLAAFQLFGCQAPSTWEPYADTSGDRQGIVAAAMASQSMQGDRVVADEGSCVACHAGCVDPHPGGRKSTCTHCHGGDATATTVAGAHPAPLFPPRAERGQASAGCSICYRLMLSGEMVSKTQFLDHPVRSRRRLKRTMPQPDPVRPTAGFALPGLGACL